MPEESRCRPVVQPYISVYTFTSRLNALHCQKIDWLFSSFRIRGLCLYAALLGFACPRLFRQSPTISRTEKPWCQRISSSISQSTYKKSNPGYTGTAGDCRTSAAQYSCWRRCELAVACLPCVTVSQLQQPLNRQRRPHSEIFCQVSLSCQHTHTHTPDWLLCLNH